MPKPQPPSVVRASGPNRQRTSISSLLGVASTLPGEDAKQYEASLEALIGELEATTVLQVYIAEKIHDCLWWMQRYAAQKRATIAAEMGARTMHYFSKQVAAEQAHVRDAVLLGKVDAKAIAIAAQAGHTIESLMQLAHEKKGAFIKQLDEQIALQAKILAGLQASYEVAFNRKTNVERLRLQNDLMRRDLGSIEVAVREVQPSDKRKAAGRKQT